MATWVGRVFVRCPTGRVVERRLTGSPDSVIKRSTHFDARSVGPGCSVQGVHIVKRGVGAGLPDKLYGSRRARYAPDPGADSHLMANAYRHVSSFGGAACRRKRKARR